MKREGLVCRGFQGPLKFGDFFFFSRTQRTQHVLIVTSMIYLSEIHKAKLAKTKEFKSRGNKVQASKSHFLVESQRALSGKLIRDLVPRGFTTDLSHRHPLPNTYQNS